MSPKEPDTTLDMAPEVEYDRSTGTVMRVGLLFCWLVLSFNGMNAVELRAESAGQQAGATRAANHDPAAVWEAFIKSTEPLPVPESWQRRQPTPEELARFRSEQGAIAGRAAQLARDFHTRFPSDPKAGEAREHEYRLVETAVALGNRDLLERLQELETERLKDPELTEDERFEIRARAVQRNAMMQEVADDAAVFAAFAEGVRSLKKEFPNRPEVYDMLLGIAARAEPKEAREIAREILNGRASMPAKEAAANLLRQLERIGKPLSLTFTAFDGRQVDLQQMRGKVVLIDFWATWCGPCVAALPELKRMHANFGKAGLEIIGISFDRNQERFADFVVREQLDWPHYFDGKIQNDLGTRFGIQSLPAMWLVDKKGILRDVNAGENLAEKIQNLLAEEG